MGRGGKGTGEEVRGALVGRLGIRGGTDTVERKGRRGRGRVYII